MRKLTYLVLALTALYSAYWFVGSRALASGINAQIAAMQADGWVIETSDLSTRGYPSRFDTTATDLTIATPDGSFALSAPFVQALSLSYKPNAVILALPNHLEVTLGNQPFQVASDGFRASATVAANTALDLTQFIAEVGQMTVDIAAGNLFSITNGIVALRPIDPAPNTYEIYADLDDLALPEGLRTLLDPQNALPATLTQVTIDSNITLARTLDRHALTAGELPRLDALKLNSLTLAWGTVELRSNGEITIDSAGVPTGKITLNAQNWQQLFTMAVSIGAVDPNFVNTVKNMANLMSGGSSDLSLDISFQNGMMSAGPIPLGPAPRLR